jgi:hypothetical protein
MPYIDELLKKKKGTVKLTDLLQDVYGKDYQSIVDQQPKMQGILTKDKGVSFGVDPKSGYYGEYTDQKGQKRKVVLGGLAYKDNVELDTLLHEFSHRVGDLSGDPQINAQFRPTPTIVQDYFDPTKSHVSLGYETGTGEPVSKSGFQIGGGGTSSGYAPVVKNGRLVLDNQGKPLLDKTKSINFTTVPGNDVSLDADSENFARWLAVTREYAYAGGKHPLTNPNGLDEGIQEVINFGKTNPKVAWHTKDMMEGLDKKSKRFNPVLYDQVKEWSKEYSDKGPSVDFNENGPAISLG